MQVEDASEIYRDLADEDRRLAEIMWPLVKETWPRDGLCGADILWQLGNHLRRCGIARADSNHVGVLIENDDKIVLKQGDGPPFLVAEVCSNNEPIGKLMERIIGQLRCGTKLVWVIDPVVRYVVVYRPGREPYVVRHDQELTGDDVLPDFRCKVAEFFAGPGKA